MAADPAEGVATPPSPPAAGPVFRAWEWFEDKIVLNLGVLCFVVAMSLMLFEAISRAAVGESYHWIEEIVRYAVVWAFFLCLALSARHGFHIRADFVHRKLSPRLQHACDVISAVCGVLFAGFLCYAGTLQTMQLYRNGLLSESAMDLEMWKVQIMLPIGAAMLLIFYLGALWRGLTRRTVFAESIEIE
jgi:TRAP-type C4-dicarboxylate transport system permease small subunit